MKDYSKYFKGHGQTPTTEHERMVADLFKKDPVPLNMLMHAVIGLAGESGEWRAATSFKNAQEEAGDFRFYMVAIRQRLSLRPGGIEETKEVIESPYYTPNHATVMDNIHIISCEILDLAKKSWVYGREVKQYEIWQQLALLEINFRYQCEEVMGVDIVLDVEDGNLEKLLKGDKARYKTGSYSDAQALARADKE